MLFGLALLRSSAQNRLIEPPDSHDKVVLAALFVVVALAAFRLVSVATIRSLTIHELGRDLTWDGLAFAAALFSAYIASSVDLRIFPDMSELKDLMIAVTALFLVLVVMLCEAAMAAMEDSGVAMRPIPCTFGAISYTVAFLLTLSHISLHR